MYYKINIIFAFLSLYLSDYNFIKKLFSELKIWMWRYKTLMKKFKNKFSAFIYMTV